MYYTDWQLFICIKQNSSIFKVIFILFTSYAELTYFDIVLSNLNDYIIIILLNPKQIGGGDKVWFTTKSEWITAMFKWKKQNFMYFSDRSFAK